METESCSRQIYAKKTIRDNYDFITFQNELDILRAAMKASNPHLIGLRCAYQQGPYLYHVTYPWCELDLARFFLTGHSMSFWSDLNEEEQLILATSII
jgi:hypothetical protein